ncbi:hypothetical protein [Silicimonas sp. MF1-12-2]|uniref:hypothetical protein n=1 Tax=Silicimonas sp. MF1-12-2 TaxID=3384793 RepID=UPI0039B44B54
MASALARSGSPYSGVHPAPIGGDFDSVPKYPRHPPEWVMDFAHGGFGARPGFEVDIASFFGARETRPRGTARREM